MTPKGILKLVNVQYWPWAVDLLVSFGSFLALCYSSYLALFNPNGLAFLATLLAVFPMFYSTRSGLAKWNEDRELRDSFQRKVGPFLVTCQTVFELHLPESLKILPSLEKSLIRSHLVDWKRYRHIQRFEYELIETLLSNLAASLDLGDAKRLFLQYVLVTSTFQLHFPRLAHELKDGDFYTEGSPYNQLIRLLYEFMASNAPLCEITVPDIDAASIEETVNICLNMNYEWIKELAREQESRRKVEYLLGKCYENAYTYVGNLNLALQGDESAKMVILYKYDERFTILKRTLNSRIKEYVVQQRGESDASNAMIEELKREVGSLLTPLPLGRALSEFGDCIERLAPRDYFTHVVYPERFEGATQGWSAQRFIEEIVLPRAQEHLDDLNRTMLNRYPFLRGYEKKTIDANYYLFELNRSDFSSHASQEAILPTVRKFLVRDIVDLQESGDIIASQLMYLKQVINKLTISGLLFTEDKAMQDQVRGFERELDRSLQQQGVHIENTYDVAHIGNQRDLFISALHRCLHGAELKRRYGTRYEESRRLANVIITNAQDLIEVFSRLHEQNQE